MTFRQLDIVVGADKLAVTVATSATAIAAGATSLGGATGLRLLVDAAVFQTSVDVALAIEALRVRITEGTWPPGQELLALGIWRSGRWDDSGYWVDLDIWKDD